MVIFSVFLSTKQRFRTFFELYVIEPKKRVFHCQKGYLVVGPHLTSCEVR